MNGRPVKHRWIYRASRMQLAVIATISGVTVWMVMSGMDLIAPMYTNLVAVPMATLNALVGLACGVLIFRLMLAERSRHQRVLVHLHAIAEINHHIRNALDRIELTAHVTHNQKLIDDIDGGVERINWALRELLPEEEPE